MNSRTIRQVYTRVITFTRAVGARVNRILKPLSASEDSRRQEYILNIILALSISFLIVLEGTIIWNYVQIDNYGGISPIIFGLIILVCVSLLVSSKTGHARVSSYALIGIFTLGTIYGGWTWGVSLPPILLSLVLIIVTSSVLIGSFFGLISTIATIAILVVLSVHEKMTLNIPTWHYAEISLTDILTYGAMLMFISFIAWLSNREIDKSLSRARKSEKLVEQERDLLEQKVAERTSELVVAKEDRIIQLEKDARFGELSQGLFHDLMNPLSSISLYTERLATRRTSPEEMLDILKKTTVISKRMGSYMNNIKHFIRPKFSGYANDTTILQKELDVIYDIFAFKARMLNIKLLFEYPDYPISIKIHPIRIYQLLSNLISNGIDACAQANNKQDHTVSVSITKNNHNIRILVSDTGCGIFTNHKDISIKPGFSTKPNGLGIGLYTVKNIVEKDLEGTINITQNENSGTSFIIIIPINSNDRENTSDNRGDIQENPITSK